MTSYLRLAAVTSAIVFGVSACKPKPVATTNSKVCSAMNADGVPQGCVAATVDQAAGKGVRTYNFKALGGISMGAIGATFLAGYGDNHKKIDAVAAMGGPIDAAYFLGGFERMQMGGFCSNTQIEQLMTASPTRMNDPTAMSCPPSTPLYDEHIQDFNDWRFTDSGSDFDRSQYLDLFFDLSLAMGNPLMYNPNSSLFPIDLPESMLPAAKTNTLPSSMCETPIVFSKANGNPIYNAEYNPDGSHDVITFCDAQEPIYFCNDSAQSYVDWCQLTDPTQVNSFPQTYCASLGASGFQQASTTNNADLFYAKKGHFNPCYPRTANSPGGTAVPVTFGLAVDYNGNGKRDYFEPVFLNGHERFQDVGVDGCSDAYEDGKGGCSTTPTGLTGDPNHDNYNYLLNPSGTEGDWKWEKGEPFNDYGLDGVPNTGDYGENDGKYNDSPSRENWLASDFRSNYLNKWTEEERRSIDVYMEGGIRDVFNFGLSADIVASGPRDRYPNESSRFLDFTDYPPLAGFDWSNGWDATQVDWSQVGRNVYLRYGTANPTEAEFRNGDGDHVGTAGQAAFRTVSFIFWLSHVWESVLPVVGPVDGTANLIHEEPFLNTLKAKRNFIVATPPGYDDPANANERYPVITLGHGYGMDPDGMSSTAFVFQAYMTAGNIRPMIIVFPSGRCCFTNADGTRDCREQDDNGLDFSSSAGQAAGWASECHEGNFYVNRQGFGPGDQTAYGDSMFEILDYVDTNYRTMPPLKVALP